VIFQNTVGPCSAGERSHRDLLNDAAEDKSIFKKISNYVLGLPPFYYQTQIISFKQVLRLLMFYCVGFIMVQHRK